MAITLPAATLARLRERCFDAVLMDVNLPGMNGLEATRRIRAAQESGFADIPVIGISAHVQEEQIEAHLRAGMTGFVAKPVSPERLSKALDAALQGQTGGIYLSSRMSSSRNVARITVLHRMHRENVADFGAERANAIIRVLRDQLPEEQDRLEDALRRQDWEALRQTAHRLKGAVGNYDFAEVTEALTALEASAAAGDGARAESRMRELSALLPGLRNSVTALLEGEAQASSAAR